MRPLTLLFWTLLGTGLALAMQDPPQEDAGDEVSLALVQDELAQVFASQGIVLLQDQGICAIPAEVNVTNDLLEYLLVAQNGAMHESLFSTGVDAELLNAALLALGVEPGINAQWAPKEPQPSEEELRQGISPYTVELPHGDAFYLYAAWREGEELYYQRVEDLVRDLASRRTMRRHAWVYLGSRMVPRAQGGGERFAAAAEGNLINISYFTAGNTLLTAALEACVEQTIWIANPWLLPQSHSPVLFIFSRQRQEALPAALATHVPVLAVPGTQAPLQR